MSIDNQLKHGVRGLMLDIDNKMCNYFEKLINLYEWALPLLNSTKCHWIYANDQIWKDYQKQDNWYYFKIRIGKQRPSYSDLGNKWIAPEF